MFNAIAQGEVIRIVANKGYFEPGGCTYLGFSAQTELVNSGEISTIADLEGRSIATAVDEMAGFILATALAQESLTLSDVDIQNIPHHGRIPALEQGAVELVYVGEPDITRLEMAGTATIFVRGEQVLPNTVWGTILFGPTLLEENPEAGNRFMIAYLKAVRQYNEGKTERNLDILVSATELDRELLEAACWPPITDDGQIDIQSVLDFQSWANERGLLDNIVTEEQFWDSTFIDYANQVLD
jgi:NitT/TauT family transport system substrate-binding protein